MSQRIDELKSSLQQLSLRSDELRDRIQIVKANLLSLESDLNNTSKQKDQLLGRLAEAELHEEAVKNIVDSINPAKKAKLKNPE